MFAIPTIPFYKPAKHWKPWNENMRIIKDTKQWNISWPIDEFRLKLNKNYFVFLGRLRAHYSDIIIINVNKAWCKISDGGEKEKNALIPGIAIHMKAFHYCYYEYLYTFISIHDIDQSCEIFRFFFCHSKMHEM